MNIIAIASKFVDANKIGGWVRAGVASILAGLIAHYAVKYPIISGFLSPEVQASIGVVASGFAVAVWSQLTKTDGAAIAKVAAMPDVEKIVVQPTASDGAGAALKDPTQTKVVSS